MSAKRPVVNGMPPSRPEPSLLRTKLFLYTNLDASSIVTILNYVVESCLPTINRQLLGNSIKRITSTSDN